MTHLDYQRLYYAANRERINATRRAWYAANKKRINKRVVEWRKRRAG